MRRLILPFLCFATAASAGEVVVVDAAVAGDVGDGEYEEEAVPIDVSSNEDEDLPASVETEAAANPPDEPSSAWWENEGPSARVEIVVEVVPDDEIDPFDRAAEVAAALETAGATDVSL